MFLYKCGFRQYRFSSFSPSFCVCLNAACETKFQDAALDYRPNIGLKMKKRYKETVESVNEGLDRSVF